MTARHVVRFHTDKAGLFAECACGKYIDGTRDQIVAAAEVHAFEHQGTVEFAGLPLLPTTTQAIRGTQ